MLHTSGIIACNDILGLGIFSHGLSFVLNSKCCVIEMCFALRVTTLVARIEVIEDGWLLYLILSIPVLNDFTLFV